MTKTCIQKNHWFIILLLVILLIVTSSLYIMKSSSSCPSSSCPSCKSLNTIVIDWGYQNCEDGKTIADTNGKIVSGDYMSHDISKIVSFLPPSDQDDNLISPCTTGPVGVIIVQDTLPSDLDELTIQIKPNGSYKKSSTDTFFVVGNSSFNVSVRITAVLYDNNGKRIRTLPVYPAYTLSDGTTEYPAISVAL